MRSYYGSEVRLNRPGSPRVFAGHARCVRTSDGILRVVVIESINIEANHQRLVRHQLMIDASIEKKLTIMPSEIQPSIGRQDKRRQRSRQEGRPILSRVIRDRKSVV